MKFKSYCEIENAYNNKMVRQAHEMGFTNPDILWVAELKIDGSNLQCSIDEEGKFKVGTRSHLLSRDDSFQGYDRAMRNCDVEATLRDMKEFIAKQKKYIEMSDAIANNKFILTVYGELFGGMYRHPDVPKVKGAVKVQGRIDYHPDNMWMPFDIVLRDADDRPIYMFEQIELRDLCARFGLLFPIIKCTGTFDECMKYPNDEPDTAYTTFFNLPPIEGNIEEGLVIKPNKAMWYNNGERVIFKNKNDKFKERMCKAPKEPKEVIPMNDLERKYFEIAREFITESRLMSVFSKVGQVNEKAFGMILGMFLKDLWKDFDKEYAEEITKLEDTMTVDEFNFSKARKEISKEVSTFIRPKFVEMLNN